MRLVSTGRQHTTKYTFASCRLAPARLSQWESRGTRPYCQPAAFPRWDERDKLRRLRPVLYLLGVQFPGPTRRRAHALPISIRPERDFACMSDAGAAAGLSGSSLSIHPRNERFRIMHVFG